MSSFRQSIEPALRELLGDGALGLIAVAARADVYSVESMELRARAARSLERGHWDSYDAAARLGRCQRAAALELTWAVEQCAPAEAWTTILDAEAAMEREWDEQAEQLFPRPEGVE